MNSAKAAVAERTFVRRACSQTVRVQPMNAGWLHAVQVRSCAIRAAHRRWTHSAGPKITITAGRRDHDFRVAGRNRSAFQRRRAQNHATNVDQVKGHTTVFPSAWLCEQAFRCACPAGSSTLASRPKPGADSTLVRVLSRGSPFSLSALYRASHDTPESLGTAVIPRARVPARPCQARER